jgi:hypothetical protein
MRGQPYRGLRSFISTIAGRLKHSFVHGIKDLRVIAHAKASG